MNECKKTLELINRKIDGLTLADSEYKSMEKHLASCAGCEAENRELSRLKELFRENFSSLETPRLSAGFDANFYKKLSEKNRPSLRELFRTRLIPLFDLSLQARLAAATAAVVLIAFVSLTQYKNFNAKLMLPQTTRLDDGLAVNSSAYYSLASRQAEKMELLKRANKQARAIIAIAGIRG